jgi:hypothetical protein
LAQATSARKTDTVMAAASRKRRFGDTVSAESIADERETAPAPSALCLDGARGLRASRQHLRGSGILQLSGLLQEDGTPMMTGGIGAVLATRRQHGRQLERRQAVQVSLPLAHRIRCYAYRLPVG